MKTRVRHLPLTIAVALLGSLTILACGEPEDEETREEVRVFELFDDEWEALDEPTDSVVLRQATALACTCTIGDGHTQTEGIYSSSSAAQADCKADRDNCGGGESASLECTPVNAPGPGGHQM